MIEQNLDVIKIGGTFLFDSQGGLKPAKLAPILEVIKKMKYLPVLIIGCGENMHQKTVEANLTDKPQITSEGLEVSPDGRVKGFISLYKEVRDHLVSISTFGRDNDFIPIHPAGAFIKRSQSFKSSEIVWFDRNRFDNQIGIPLTSGGIIPDRQILFSAISSDTIAAYLAVQLQASRLILLTGTKGVYRSMTDQVTIKKLNIADDNYQIDGGMRDKIRRIKPAVLKNIRTYIASGELEFASEIILEGIINNSTEVICN